MKNLILTFILLSTISLMAQAPQKFNYQGVARNNTGSVISNQNISVLVSILDGLPNGPIQYSEAHTVTTNQLGLFTMSIGGGTNFSNINWGSGDKYLKIEMDPTGGNNYLLSGVTQLLSVPYALQSLNSSQIQGKAIAATPPTDGQVLLWDAMAGQWVPSDEAQGTAYAAGSGITINGSNQIINTAPDQVISIAGTGATTVQGSYPNFIIQSPVAADNSPTNEIQSLSLSGNTLSLSNGGGSVTLNNGTNYNAGTGISIAGSTISNTGDLSNTNEIQAISLSGNTLSLSNGGGSVTLNNGTNYNAGTGISIAGSTISNTGDLSNTNEIQAISLSGNTLSLSNGGGSVTLNNGTNYTAGAGISISGNTISNTGDADNNATNEIQTISLSGNSLSLSNGGGSVIVDASPTNEIQALSLSGNTLSLSNGGGSVTLNNGTNYTAGSGINISGNTISNAGDADSNPTNEIQTLSLSGNNLSLSNGGGSVTLNNGTNYVAGTGINISGNTISNTGDTDSNPTNEIQSLTLSGSTLSLSNGGGAVNLPPEVDGSVTNEIQALSLSGSTLSLSNGGGSITLPTGTTYTAGTGISINVSNQISNTGDANAADDITNTTAAGGDLNGTYPNPTVKALQGKAVSSVTPTNGQVLQWNGSAWTPTTPNSSGGGWQLNGNTGTNPANNFIGTIDNQPLVFKVNNKKAGLLDYDLANGNTSFGFESFLVNTSGFFNTATGYRALNANTTGDRNTAIGLYSLYVNNTGDNNTALGTYSLSANTSGAGNTAAGVNALSANISSSNNTAVGLNALTSNTGGSSNTANGALTLEQNTTGTQNTAIGFAALNLNSTGSYNTASGLGALNSNNGSYNSAHGAYALYKNTLAWYNTANGAYALYTNTIGDSNTATGFGALYSNTTGDSNTANGYDALYSNSTGYGNTSNGRDALHSNTTGSGNIANGLYALLNNTTGDDNTANGRDALFFNQSGNENTAVGYQALYFATNSFNTALGTRAGKNSQNSITCTYIGIDANNDNGSNAYVNSTVLGYASIMTGSNQVRLGNSATGSIGGYQNWTNISDGRFKKDVQENVPGLDFIKKLRPVTYHLDVSGLAIRLNEDGKVNREGETPNPPSSNLIAARKEKEDVLQTGFIAQEVEAAAKELGYSFSGVDKPQQEDGLYGLRYAEFTVPLVKAVQEQQAEIEQLQKENAVLKAQTDKIGQMEAELQQIKALLLEKSR